MIDRAAKVIERNIKVLSQKYLDLYSQVDREDTQLPNLGAKHIHTKILEALVAVLTDKRYLQLFEENGSLYKKAKMLGELKRAQNYKFEQVIEEYLVLRKDIWALMRNNLNQDEIDIFEVEERISFCLMNILKAVTESFHNQHTRDLDKLASTDSLTGLFNRRQFDKIIEREIHRADRYQRPLALAILDIDHFKMFNDVYGHQSGDIALQRVAELIRQFLRISDTAARYGGEEFAVFLPETNEDQASKVCNRIRRAVERYHFLENKAKKQLTVSIGLACYPHDAKNAESLIKAADRCLYKAKSGGRNKVVVHADCNKTSSGWLNNLITKQ